MGDMISQSLIVPVLFLGFLGFVIPRCLGHVLPEGVPALFLNALLSTVVLFAMSSLFFFCLYLWQGVGFDRMTQPGLATNMVFFGRLGLMAALIWAPVMLVSLADLPRKWVKETW